jgi:hypothetical protein
VEEAFTETQSPEAIGLASEGDEQGEAEGARSESRSRGDGGHCENPDRDDEPPGKGHRDDEPPDKGHRDDEPPDKGHRDDEPPDKGHRDDEPPDDGRDRNDEPPDDGRDDGEEPPDEFEYLVRGQVLYRRGLPISGHVVEAVHRRLRDDMALGRAVTDDAGNYEIYFNVDAVPGRSPDLQTRVYDDDGGVLGESAVRFSAGKITKLRIQVDGGPDKVWSEFEQMMAELEPVLDGVPLHELGEDEVVLLAGKVAQPTDRIAALVVAHKLAARTSVAPEVFYGLGREKVPTNLSAMMAAGPDARREALTTAVRRRIIPARLLDEIETIESQVRTSLVRRTARDKEAPFGALLSGALPREQDRELFLERYVDHEGSPREFWDELRAAGPLGEKVDALQTTVQLSALTGAHEPLVSALMNRQGRGEFATVAELAAFTEADWQRIIEEQPVPPADRVPASVQARDEGARVRLYAQTLRRIVTDAMPTAALAYANAADDAKPADVRRFWRNVTDSIADGDTEFRLGSLDVAAHLRSSDGLLFGVDDVAAVASQLERTQRLFNLTTAPAEIDLLLAGDLSSAQDIARLGSSVFVQRFATDIGARRAELIYDKAEHIVATSIAMTARVDPQYNQLPFAVMNAVDPKDVPSLSTLFGSLDMCACGHCRSVAGPAAYLAEVLAFLHDRKQSGGSHATALEVLLERRPDLADLELSCANTDTVLPFIDLVNEVLERVVSPFVAFTVATAHAAELDARTVSDALRASFSAAGAQLSDDHFVLVISAGQHWLLTDHSVLYVVQRDGAQLRVRSATYQTGSRADQLAANPEHTWVPAYALLRDAVFPSELPLDLWREEVVTYLGHLEVFRHELMDEFSTGDWWASLRRPDIAAEHLGFSARRHRIATGTLPNTQPWQFFGLAQAANSVDVFDPAHPATPTTSSLSWVAALAWVEQLTRRASISYEELVTLLATRFVNPGGAARIVSADPNDLTSCELRKLTMTGADGALYARLHRFVIAWRQIGWTPVELDRAIAVLDRGVVDVNDRLDDAAVRGLSHIQRLRSQLSLTVDEVLALWAPIGTVNSAPDQRDSHYATLFQNPAVLYPLDADFALDGGEVAVAVSSPASAKLSTRIPMLLAAFRVSAAELNALTTALVPDDALNIETLSRIYRRVLLARGLGIGVEDLLALVEMAGLDPFSGATVDTLFFVDLADSIARSNLSIAELDYLLNHRAAERVDWAPREPEVATVLDELRTALHKVREETAARPDPAGDVARSLLAQLRWPAELAGRVIDTLAGTVGYRTALAALPADLAIPAALAERVAYDADAAQLTIRGPLTDDERDTLRNASADAAYRSAVDDLYDQPRQFVGQRMRGCEFPMFSAPLASLPPDVAFPEPIRRRVYHDAGAGRLRIDGAMTDGERALLESLSSDAAYRAAVQALYDAPTTYVPDPDNALYAVGGAAELFDEARTPAQRFELLGARLLGHLRSTGSRRAVVERIGNALGLGARDALQMLTGVMHADGSASALAIEDFVAESFAASNAGITLTAAAFPGPFRTFTRLVKTVRLGDALSLTADQAAWLARFAPGVAQRPTPWLVGVSAGWLHTDALPVAPSSPSPQRFAAWRRLCDVAELCDRLPGRFDAVAAVLGAARAPGVPTPQQPQWLIGIIADATGWEPAEIAALCSADILGVTLPGDVADETGLARLARCRLRMHRLGATAAQCAAFAAVEPDEDAARAARQLVKAKYPDPEWAQIARPLRNTLRERQRGALVAYLMHRPQASEGQDWSDTHGMYQHLLIDCEMSACALTSRLKQAIGSVQQFAQRSLLNLEPNVVADAKTDAGWADWKWMKNYRVWEANRKVFMHPENLLEPELRDDKSPLFKVAEGELVQNDVTTEVAEDIFLRYLEGLETVARLEVAGVYLEAAAHGRPEVLHVFGRTYGATTPAHYYRKRIAGRWTAWELVELDISARQLLPIVWNGRLMLVWPVFTERATPTFGDKPAPPARRFDIQIAWSELRRGKWQPKRITPQRVESIVIPDDSPDRGAGRHVLRAGIDVQGLKVWYEIDPAPAPTWVAGPYGNGGRWVGTTVGGWCITGSEGKTEPYAREITGIFEPPGTVVDGMTFREVGGQPLNLPKVESSGDAIALGNTPGVYHLTYLHQDGQITGLRPFFFADDSRTYCVESVEDWEAVLTWIQPELVDPVHVESVRRLYYEPVIVRDPEWLDPIGPIARNGVIDPVPVARALIARAAAYRQTTTHLGVPGATPLPTLQPEAHASTVDLAVAETPFMMKPRATEVALVDDAATAPSTRKLERLVVSKGDKAVLKLGDFLDDTRIDNNLSILPIGKRVRRYRFATFFHPYTTPFIKALGVRGLDGLLERATQLQRNATFSARYAPTNLVAKDAPTADGYPVEDVDFSFGGGYAIYNWELFFHLPLLIATRLTQNQRFEEAQRWLHFVFDPTDTTDSVTPRRYWRTRPFFEETQAEVQAQRIEEIIKALADGVVDPDLKGQVDEWRRNPFKPHAIARLRIAAYQKNVVMRYLDNLIAWGDQLFRRDTIESINEATQLYVLAAEILGRRPNVMPPRAEPQVRTYNTLHPSTATFSDALVDIEYLFGRSRPDSVVSDPSTPPLPLPRMLYFCIPPNDKLLGYWETVEDRLFKIRHCMNIEGVVRQLPLFEPPIDPALLVRAAAAGVDISAALSDAGAPLPIYRFNTLVGKAKELAAEVKSLGSALLGALESRDGERLALLRLTTEMAVQDAVDAVRTEQVREATLQIESQHKARAQAEARFLHYQRLLGTRNPQTPAAGARAPDARASASFTIASEDGAKLITQERNELERLSDANDRQRESAGFEIAASIAHVIPSFSVAIKPWGIGAGMSFGGSNVGSGLNAFAQGFRSAATSLSNAASRSARLGQYVLREQDWALQSNLAAKEIEHVDAQIAATEVRKEVADKELASHRKRVEQVRAEHDLMTSKYTNEELRTWLIGRISEVYFQSYRLAYDVAKRAERAYRFELGLNDSSFVQFGYWDSLRKGLLAGEQLTHDLHRMEASHLEQNRREHELTKHVSLRLLHPEALVELRQTGSCFVDLPEAIFDLDHAGHYMRRIKSVSLSMPCTVGPYANVGCKLILLSNRVRRNASLAPEYRWQGPEDPRFSYDAGGVDSIVTSSGRDDSGLFQVTFGDERYLPFEGAGAVSAWRLELPASLRQFDYTTITDVILRVSYTARDGGVTLQSAAVAGLADALKEMELGPGASGLMRLFTAGADYPDELHALLHPAVDATEQVLAFDLGADRFPVHLRDRPLKVGALAVFVSLRAPFDYDSADPLVVTVKPPGNAAAVDVTLTESSANAGGLPAGVAGFPDPGVAVSVGAGWKVTLKEVPKALGVDVDADGTEVRRLNAEALADVGLLVGYTF